MNRTGRAYGSDALAAIHETAPDLHDAALMDKRKMRRFDELCLTPVRPLTADEIRALRKRELVNQAVFCPSPERDDQPCQSVGAR